VTLVPDGREVDRLELKFQATPSIVRLVPVAPEAHPHPPFVVFRGTCMIEGALLVDPTLATATPFSLFGILRTETDEACGHDKVVEVAVAAVVGPWLPAAS